MNENPSKNTQNSSTYHEFDCEREAGEEFSRENSTDFSISSVYGRKCGYFFGFFCFLSLLTLCFGISLVILPEFSKTFLNNQRLRQLFESWAEDSTIASFSGFLLEFVVISSEIYVDFQHLAFDPLYFSEKYYNASVFLANFSNNSNVSGSNSQYIREKLGVLDLSFGNYQETADSFCFSVYETSKNSETSLKSDYNPIENLPFCGESRGFMLIPWKSREIRNLSAEDCETLKGFYAFAACYQFFVAEDVCLQVSVRNSSLFFEKGCYDAENSSEIARYSPAEVGKSYNFENFTVFVRHIKDPYVILANFFGVGAGEAFFFNGEITETLVFSCVWAGGTGIFAALLGFLVLKAEFHAKFKVL